MSAGDGHEVVADNEHVEGVDQHRQNQREAVIHQAKVPDKQVS